MNDLKILVTGSNRGLGKLILDHFDNLYIVHGTSRKKDSLFHLDFTKPSLISNDVNRILKIFLPEILIHNAGIGASGLMGDFTKFKINKLFQTNLFGPLKFIDLFLKLNNNLKLIIIISSDAVFNFYPGLGLYTASKIALEKSLKDYSYFYKIPILYVRPKPLLLPGKNYIPTILKGKKGNHFFPSSFHPPLEVLKEIENLIKKRFK